MLLFALLNDIRAFDDLSLGHHGEDITLARSLHLNAKGNLAFSDKAGQWHCYWRLGDARATTIGLRAVHYTELNRTTIDVNGAIWKKQTGGRIPSYEESIKRFPLYSGRVAIPYVFDSGEFLCFASGGMTNEIQRSAICRVKLNPPRVIDLYSVRTSVYVIQVGADGRWVLFHESGAKDLPKGSSRIRCISTRNGKAAMMDETSRISRQLKPAKSSLLSVSQNLRWLLFEERYALYEVDSVTGVRTLIGVRGDWGSVNSVYVGNTLYSSSTTAMLARWDRRNRKLVDVGQYRIVGSSADGDTAILEDYSVPLSKRGQTRKVWEMPVPRT